ncbi:hypothetical protein [Mycolicibacterium gilvum]|uniref:Transmembrane protein n=1 Tax=Mycolicibacterium gilvum TaxID=1804 RepID=A0A378SV98_9MYCO|nr:hypothetical protein [Mycolicibacterium gilvum]MCV7058127.1 hypothetical protein [Mycolicibacterium gilvum]STZ46008.1 transmembrane protein [Mycolicibacterium gilvum]
MGRTAAVIWHASFSIAAGVLYFFFVLPRTPELLGDTSHTLGTVLRVVTGALIGLAALPVVFTLLRTRRPEFGTPKLALNLRTASIALHVLAGVLILGTAISEIWLSVDSAGQWLFGIYGAAAAIGLLGVFAFYLAFVAELPPPPPKPLKATKRTGRGRKGDGSEDSADVADSEGSEGEVLEAEPTDAATDEPTDGGTDADVDTGENGVKAEDAPAAVSDADDADDADGKLRNRRPTGKGTGLGRRKRTRGGVAVED